MTSSFDRDNRTWAERYRAQGEIWADAEAAASVLEDMKSAVMAQKQVALGDMPVSRAEMTVKASPDWEEYVRSCVEARKIANLAKINLEAERIAFMEWNNKESNARAEMKLV